MQTTLFSSPLSRSSIAALFASAWLLSGCRDSFAKDAPEFAFVDRAQDVGIAEKLVSGDPRRWYIIESNGSGAAWLDYDSDGDPDLFLANGCGVRYLEDGARLELERTATSRLYRNDGDWQFSDVTEAAGASRSDWINAVATGDIDNDGDPDLYLACFGADVLLRNDAGRFVDVTRASSLGNERWGAGAVFLDVDKDGALDLFVSNYVEFDLAAPPAGGARDVIEGVEIAWGPIAENPHGYNPGAHNLFYSGDGSGNFVERTEQAGLRLPTPSCSYAAVSSDLDGDGWPDLVVANDGQASNLFMNQGDGTFRDEAELRGFAFDGDGNATAAMGVTIEDVDQDGDMDVLRTNFDFELNTLLINDGTGRFVDRTLHSGLGQPSFDKLGWAAAFFDAECDGDLDLAVANGHVMPQAEQIGMSGWRMPTQLFACELEPNGLPRFTDVTNQAGPGLGGLHSARGMALADVDDDGDVDLCVTALDEPPRLLENRSQRRGHWVQVGLEGTRSNRSAFGAKIEVHVAGRTYVREMRSTQGLYSSHDTRLHFGLGEARSVDRIVVHWPSGVVSGHEDIELDTFVELREPEQDPR